MIRQGRKIVKNETGFEEGDKGTSGRQVASVDVSK